MQLAIVLSLAACFCTATASVCQRLGARNLERTPAKAGGFDPWLVFRLARQPAWLLGLTCMIAGFGFQVGALRFGPLALVQPILAIELLFVFGYLALLPAARRSGPRVRGRDWLAVAVMCAGISLFLRAAAPSGGRDHAPAGLWWLAAAVTLAVVAIAIALSRTGGRVVVAPGRLPRHRHRHHLGLRGRRDQGAQLARRRRPGRHLHQLVGLRAHGHRRGRHAAGLARLRGGPAGRVPARLHHPRPGHRHPARRLPLQRAPGDLAGRPHRRGDRPAPARRRRLRPQPQRPHHRRTRRPTPRPRSPDPAPPSTPHNPTPSHDRLTKLFS